MVFAKFPTDNTAGASAKIFPLNNRTCPTLPMWSFASSFVYNSPEPVVTVVGLFKIVTVSDPVEFTSFLLIMCIDAPESTTNSLSSTSILENEWRHQFSAIEKKQNHVFRDFQHVFGQPPRCFKNTSLLSFRLFLRPILKFWIAGVALMRILSANISELWILDSNVGMTQCGCGELGTSDWLQNVWTLP